MKALEERSRREGRILPGNVGKVDGFLNHQIDTKLMGELADEFARLFDLGRVTKILTAEASGIAMAAICAYRWGLPMIFAKKAKSDNLEGGLFRSQVMSYTYKKQVTLIAAKDWLKPEDKILILDDFLARAQAIRGLIDIVKQSGAELVGIGIAVEKGFQHGGDGLRQEGYPIKSLAVIDGADELGFRFREQE